MSSLLDITTVDKTLTPPAYAFELNQRLIFAKRQSDFLFLIIGKILKEIREKRLYEHLDYSTFSSFLSSNDVSFSKESAFMYIRVYEYYIEELQMSEQVIENISVSRLSMLIPVLKKIEDRNEVVELVQEYGSLTHNDFMLKLRQKKHDDKPTVYYSKSIDRWVVEYWSNRTNLFDKGELVDDEPEIKQGA